MLKQHVVLTAAALSLCGPFGHVAAAATRTSGGAAPFSLTASDGTGLQLKVLAARAVVQGPLAFTQLRLTFHNPQPRVLEGRFTITMPQGAAISRFAMKIEGQWQEAEVVERQRARQVYESFMHQRVDPALLERKAANQFQARVFPIPGRGDKELIIAYSQELSSQHQPYRLPLLGLPRIGRLAIAAKTTSAAGRTRATRFVRRGYRPDRDFELAQPLAPIAGLTHGALSVARVRPTFPEGNGSGRMDSLLVLFDTSASRAGGFAAQVQALGELVSALVNRHGPRLTLRVVGFDQTVEPLYEGRAARLSAVVLAQIRDRQALGASNLAQALAGAMPRGVRRYRRALLITDGVATAGAIHPRRLRRATAHLKARGVQRLDVLLVGGVRDEPAMRRLAAGNGFDHEGTVLDGELPGELLARRLSMPVRSGIRVRVPGAAWAWPTRLDGIQPGDEVLVYASRAKKRPATTLEVRLSGAGLPRQAHRVRLHPAAGGGALLLRAWARARIQWLSTVPRFSTAVARKIVDLSTRHRVLSDLTAMLVLETEQDYKRFNLTRRGLSNLLVVDEGGLRLQRRQPHLRRVDRRAVARARRRLQPAEVRAARSRLERLAARMERPARGGQTRSGQARGRMLARRARTPRAPRVVVGHCRVSGSLDKLLLRRTVRRQLNKIRHCYERELQADRALAGRVTVHFVIAQGRVVRSRIAGSSLNNRPAEACIARTFFNLRFPQPKGGGVVEVFYPLVLQPARQSRSARRLAGGRRQRPPVTLSAAPVDYRRPLPSVVARDARLSPVPDPTAPVPPDLALIRAAARAAQREPPIPNAGAYSGRMLTIKTLIARGKLGSALRQARHWRQTQPGDLLAFVALGDALRAAGSPALAARAYGSIIDLHPSRAEMRRFAGGLLQAVGQNHLASDSYARAVRQRPDHPSGHRMLALALLRRGLHRRAFSALAAGLRRRYPNDRFAGVKRVLREDLALVAAAWIARRPNQRAEILKRLRRYKLSPAARPSLRLVLSWETDASDLDLHLVDPAGARVNGKKWMTDDERGYLHNDVTTGYGPERVTIGRRLQALTHRIQVHAFSRESTGYGLGKVQIVHHDGRGGVRFDERPFVVMKDQASVDVGPL
jgi:Vault protein inter-alpha-trypsin domain